MFTSKTHGSIYLKQKIIKTIFVAIMGAVCLFSFVAMLQREVQAAPSSHLNFQARLLSASGAIVPDGNYHIEFKLYDAASSGTLLWTETRSTGNLVTVKNGYLSVYLGDVNSFPTTIDWDNQLWLTMNIGGAGGSASWDGEMSPRIKLTAVPYAFQAGQLAQTSGSNRGTLRFDTVANNPDLILPDESGTLCVQGSANCGFIQGSGTAFLQGGNTFSGTTAGTLGTINNGALNLITNNTTRLTVEAGGNIAMDTNTLYVDAANDRVGLGTATPTYKFDLLANYGNIFRLSSGASDYLTYVGRSLQMSGANTHNNGIKLGIASAAASFDIQMGVTNTFGTSPRLVSSTGLVIKVGNATEASALTAATFTNTGNVEINNNLTVDTNTLFVDATNNRVGIGTATPTTKLDISGGSLQVTGTHTGTSEISVTGSGTRMFFDVGKSAFRAGAASGSVWDGANNGAYSAAFGYNTAASTWGFAAGQSTSAAAQAVAFGAGTNASGVASAAFGWVTTAQAYGSMAIGQCNVAQGTTSSLVSIDTAFSIGNGTFSGTCSTNSNAFQVAYNGSTTINGGTLLVQGTHGGGVGNTVTGAGTRMFFDVNKSAFRTGAVTGTQWNDANVGNYSFAGGLDSTASGSYAFAYGQQTSAAGNHSTALGAYTRTGNPYAFAVGYDSGATGQASQTMGYGLEMQAFAATALGYCNYTGTGQSTNTWVAAEQLFAIGNGTYSGSDCTVRQNALEMTKNGNLAVDTNTLFVDAVNNRVGVGTAAPDSKLHVVDSSTSTTAGNLYGTNVEVTDTGNVSSGFDVTAAVRGSATRTGASGGNITSIGGYFSAVGDAGGSSIAYGTLGTGYGADTSIGVQGSGRFSGTVDTLIGVSGTADTFLAGGTATNAYGLRGGVLTANYAVTITNAAGLQVDSATKHASGTITNNYGIRVENQTAGVSDYGLYIEGADTYALWVDSGATRLDGTLEVQSTSTFTGLTTLNGGLTVEAGDTFTFNGDAITDLTGTGLTLSTGALTVDNTVLDDTFFMQGGNSYGATAVLGTNDNNNLELETNGTTRLTINTSGDANLTGNLTIQGTGASSVAGTLAVTDHVSFGADATIDGDATVFGAILGDATASSVVTINEDVTDFTNTMVNGQSINITANPGSAYSGYISGQLIGTQVGGASSAAAAFAQGSFLYMTDDVTVGTAIGNFSNVMVDTTGDVTDDLIGEFNQIYVSSAITGAVTGSANMLSVQGTGGATAGRYYIAASGSAPYVMGLDVTNAVSGGTVTDQYGMAIALQSQAGSTITTSIGLDIVDVTHYGTVTDNYGLRVGIMSGATNNYGLAVEASTTQTLWISSNADNTTAAAGLAFGSSRDTNLYRSAANTLMTDDSFTAAGNLSIQGNTTLGNANTDTLTINGTAVSLPNNLNFDSDTLYIDATNNRIGIGDATPDFKLDVEGTSTAGGVGASEALTSISFTDNGNVTSGTENTVGLNVNVTRTGATGGTILTTGINATASGDTGGTSAAAGVQGVAYNADTNYGVVGQSWLVGGSNVTEVVGVNGVATQLFGGGATATNGFGLQGEVLMNGNTSVTNGAGLNIKSATASGGGAITNNYGVRIQNQTAGTNDYGLYIEGADTYALWVDSGATRLDGTVIARATSDAADVFQLQNSNGATLFSLDATQSGNLAANSGAETSATFTTNWTTVGTATISRTTTSAQVASGDAGVSVAAGTTLNNGVRNNLASNPAVSTLHAISFSAKLGAGSAFTDVEVAYSYNGGTNLTACSNYNTRTITTNGWTKITCSLTTPANAVTNADLIIRQPTAAGSARTFYIDNLTMIAQTSGSTTSTIRVGGPTSQGLTLLTLDSFAERPWTGSGNVLHGSMYYDTTLGKIQCYEADGWGACGGAPDNIVNLVPEYSGSVLNGTGVGTMTADLCSGTSFLSINTSLCGSTESRNFYKWTSPQASAQTYSIYISYQLPATFNGFADANTIKLTGRTSSTSGGNGVTFALYQANGTQCGSTTTVNSSVDTWQTTNLAGDETACSFAANDVITFRINMTATGGSSAFASNFSFTTLGK